MSERVDELVKRLSKGAAKTAEILGSLGDEQWNRVLYKEPVPWTVRDMLAHFLSAEEALLRVAKDIAAGGPGAPEGFDYDDFNIREQVRLIGTPPKLLLADLAAARTVTIAWVRQLSDAGLDRTGRHPALGVITIENFVTAMYGHQLMHMRDLQRLLM